MLKSAATPVLLPLILLSCRIHPGPPAYMREASAGGPQARRAVEEIRAELGPGFAVAQVEEIYFVATDGAPELFEECRETISRIDAYLHRAYFRRRPTEAIRVYLFQDPRGYEAHVREAYGTEPSTPFGFYVASERKMVMNISTGTGTLAHELVHPLLAEDFPETPSWFNEGFASLFEQSRTDRDGNVWGLVNWRLPGLKRAIRERRAISFADLLRTDQSSFYADELGVNYAVARYLCLWLQEEGLLERYYREFRSSARVDPTGRAALERVTGRPVDELNALWLEWVSGLEFR